MHIHEWACKWFCNASKITSSEHIKSGFCRGSYAMLITIITYLKLGIRQIGSLHVGLSITIMANHAECILDTVSQAISF